MYTPKDYYPAICLALNYEAGNLEIHDFMYHEDSDIWYVELTDHAYRQVSGLEGKFVRSCYKAYRRGVISWTNTKAV